MTTTDPQSTWLEGYLHFRAMNQPEVALDWFISQPDTLRAMATFFNVPLPEQLELGPEIARALDMIAKKAEAYFNRLDALGHIDDAIEAWPAWMEGYLVRYGD